ncbi:MAG TPA: P-loop NTPase fold protein, partial [Myxococcaceae bacterium]|nr:P-loop NTPase fold protein [Myxococcaceae bacterium]
MKRPERGPRLRWAWWLITAAVAAGCSAAAFWQAPASNADSPPRGLSALFHPFERNAWLRLPRGQQVHGTATPVSVQALSADEAWVGISDGSAVHTTDGGRTWRSVALPKPPGAALRVLRFAEGLRGWALYSGGALYTSYDGGGTWEQDRLEGAREARILGLAVSRDGKHAVCIGELAVWGWRPGQAWLRMADAPGSSSKLPPPEFLDPVAVAPNGTHLAASFGQVVRGGAYGRGSEPLAGDIRPTALQLSPDGRRAWLTGEDGTIRALEGGTVVEQYRGQAPLYDLSVLDGGLGWAVGANGQLVTTSNGDTWQRKQPPGATLTAIAMADPERGWALSGDPGRAYSAPGTDTVWRTEDGGETWHRRLVLSERLLAPTVDKDGIATVETSAGARLQSDDGGHGWTVAALGPAPKVAPKAKAGSEPQRCGARECTFRTVVAQSGWAFDEQGLLVTRDGGRTWARASAGFRPTALAGGKREGYPFFVATDGHALYFASSGGWEPVRYSWWPAPWYFLSLAVVALLVRHSIKAPARPKRESVADLLVSDKPIESITDDVLGIHELAQGMSRFIRNDQTQPSLTLSVSGEWGSGKSSLLNLLQADLRRFGYHPVWFNAWHHEQEENLIAALYAQIISQATPPFCSWESLTFRLRLLRRQRGKLSGIFMASLLLLTAGAGYFVARQERWLDVLESGSQTLEAVATFLSSPDEKAPEAAQQPSKYTFTFKQSPDGAWEGGVESVTPPTPPASAPPSQWIAAISALLGLLGVGRSVLNRLRAFGVDPARFAASLAGSDR